ncbi:MAG: NAD-dependent epimerase/dehydratase family protein [Myxococcales bacterium]|nr:NAD-dependent epimerase/dehydratase family protein [Myxococcales bacterium]
MKVLITGAAGHLGAALANLLCAEGHRVLGLDVRDAEDPSSLPAARLAGARASGHFSLERCDVRDALALQEPLRRFLPEAVVHLAGRRDLEWAEAHPAECLRLNAGAGLQLLAECRRLRIGQVVLLSSAHAYGASRRYPQGEDDPCDRPLSALGAACRALELGAHALSLRTPVNITVFRLFSLYGPWPSPHRLLPTLARAAAARRPLPIAGDGSMSRDLIFVDDAAAAMRRALERPAPFRILNLGSGESTTLLQVAGQVAARFDVLLRSETWPLRPGELPQAWADVRRLRDELGFAPAVTPEEGLRRFCDWFQALPDELRRLYDS